MKIKVVSFKNGTFGVRKTTGIFFKKYEFKDLSDKLVF